MGVEEELQKRRRDGAPVTEAAERARVELARALRAARQGRMFSRLRVLWPGITASALRAAAWMGGEIACPGDGRPVLHVAFERADAAARRPVGEPDDALAYVGALVGEAAWVLCCEACEADAGERACWDPRRQGFISWRRRHHGPLRVRWREAPPAAPEVRVAARWILTREERVRMLGLDLAGSGIAPDRGLWG